MSRTIVVFHLPSNQLAYLELADLVSKPVEGGHYVLDGVRYRATDVTESIGEFKADGSRRGGMEKLLEILAVLFDKDALTLLKGLRNIGSGDQPEVKGGIIIPNASVVGDFDTPIVVRLKAVSGSKSSGDVLGQLLQAFAPGGDAAEPATDVVNSPAVPPIIVGDEAAS